MGDRCWMELDCRIEDLSRFEDLGFERDEYNPPNNPALARMVDEQANYGHSSEMPTDLVYAGTASAGDEYGACEYACDGESYWEMQCDDQNGGFLVRFDEHTGEPDAAAINRVRDFILFRNKVYAMLKAMQPATVDTPKAL